jgi:hypothetical protein
MPFRRASATSDRPNWAPQQAVDPLEISPQVGTPFDGGRRVGPVSEGAGGADSDPAVPMIAAALLLTMFLPEELSFYFGSIRMTVARLVLIITMPLVLVRMAGFVTSREYRFVWNDAIVAVLGVWMIVSTTLTEDLSRGFAFGGSAALEFCMPYYVARTYLTKRGDLMATVKFLLYLLAIVGFLGLADWDANKAILKETAADLTGYVKEYVNSRYDWRYGLLRAYSVSDHPIHLGLMSAFGLLLARAYHGAGRKFIVAGCLTGLVTAISSAPIGAFIVGVALMFGDHIFRRIRAPMRVLPFGAVAFALLIIFLGSRNPWATIFSQITFDPSTAYYRLMQWELIWPYVMQSPWIGIGESMDFLRDELMPSVDSLWLRSAMTFGIPGALLTFATFFGSMSIPVKLDDPRLNLSTDENRLAHALGVVFIVGAFAATTVYFWNMVWMLTGFLAGVRAQLGNLAVLPRNESAG